MGHLSPRGLHEGYLEGGLLSWGPQKICSLRLWNWRLFPYGTHFWGTWRDALFLGLLR